MTETRPVNGDEAAVSEGFQRVIRAQELLLTDAGKLRSSVVEFLEEPIIKYWLSGGCQCDPDVGYRCDVCDFHRVIHNLRKSLKP